MPKKTFSSAEVSTLFQTAQRVVRHPILDLLVSPKDQDQHARILVVTPRRIGTAPARNKIRRQLKAIFYEEKLFEQPYDCVVIIKNIEPATFEILKKLLVDALGKYR